MRLRYRALVCASVVALLPYAAERTALADCPQDLNELSAVVETPQNRGTSAGAVQQLQNIRDVARRLQESGDTVGCTRVAQQGLAMWRRAATVDLAPVDAVTGLRVVGTQGEKIGSINDLIIDLATGQIVFAIVKSGGFLGIGTESYAIPWKVVTRSPGADSVTISISRQRLETAPRFNRNEWEDLARSDWAASVFTYFGVEPHWAPVARSATDLRNTEIESLANRLKGLAQEVDLLAKNIQELRAAADQASKADHDARTELAARLESFSQRLDQLEAMRGPGAVGAQVPQDTVPPEAPAGTTAPPQPDQTSPTE